ncbi:unnamed protein product, partial [Rotaria socialis]
LEIWQHVRPLTILMEVTVANNTGHHCASKQIKSGAGLA